MSKLVLLTGFLGAGKTTFLNHILEEFSGTKVGLIVNEFSGTGVDGALIRQDIPGAKMIELNNGSIFCACIKDSFVDSLISLADRDLDYVFVEASGLADPSSISSILDQIRTLSGASYDYCGAVCLVDALYFPKYLKLLLALRRQVEYSRAVILNKTDLVDEEQLSQVEASIREINPKAAIHRSTYARVSLRAILSEGAPGEAAARETSNTESSRLVTVTLSTAEAVSPEALRRFLENIAPATYRVKGFCKTTVGMKNISMVGSVLQMEDWGDALGQTQLVIISSVGVRIFSEVLSAAKECYRDPVDLK